MVYPLWKCCFLWPISFCLLDCYKSSKHETVTLFSRNSIKLTWWWLMKSGNSIHKWDFIYETSGTKWISYCLTFHWSISYLLLNGTQSELNATFQLTPFVIAYLVNIGLGNYLIAQERTSAKRINSIFYCRNSLTNAVPSHYLNQSQTIFNVFMWYSVDTLFFLEIIKISFIELYVSKHLCYTEDVVDSAISLFII